MRETRVDRALVERLLESFEPGFSGMRVFAGADVKAAADLCAAVLAERETLEWFAHLADMWEGGQGRAAALCRILSLVQPEGE